MKYSLLFVKETFNEFVTNNTLCEVYPDAYQDSCVSPK